MPQENFSKVCFYIVAHADDWQLFMQPNAFNDLASPDTKVVFIITTAGDAGADETYWLSREEGLKSSVRFCMSPIKKVSESVATRNFFEHSINCWSANSARCYFLRLPDGNLDGKGFATYQFQSLNKLRTGEFRCIKAVDGSASYDSWKDLCATLQSIIEFESKDISDIFINYLNPDRVANPNDHVDHIGTGQAVQDMAIVSNLKQTLFVGYSVHTMQKNLAPADMFWKAGMFAAYEKAVCDISGYSTLKEDIQVYQRWCLSAASFTINS